MIFGQVFYTKFCTKYLIRNILEIFHSHSFSRKYNRNTDLSKYNLIAPPELDRAFPCTLSHSAFRFKIDKAMTTALREISASNANATRGDIAKRLAPRIVRDYFAAYQVRGTSPARGFFFRAKRRLARKSWPTMRASEGDTHVATELRSSVAGGRRGCPRRGGLRNRPVSSRGASASRQRKRRDTL